MSDSNKPTLGHWINGRRVISETARRAAVFDPALGEATKEVVLADATETAAAVEAARRAFEEWSQLSAARRQTVVFRFRELLNSRKEELARIITSEHGKAVSDAAAEVQRGLEVVDLATAFPHLTSGRYAQNVSTGVDVHSVRQPLGVVAVISPFNFPAMVPLWFTPIAIAVGNTVVLKPSERVPSAAIWLAELWKAAGLPDGVFNVLQGDRVAVETLLDHPDVQAVSFVGSTPVARSIYESAARVGKRVQAFGGAKNHMLVLADADLDAAADQAVSGGFGSAGERCMAISVVLAEESIADELNARIQERAARLRVDDGRTDPDMGPLITRQHRDRVASYIDIAERDGATVLLDGRQCRVDGHENGFWLGPTLLDRVPTTSKAYEDEIFGPVLAVVRVKDLDEGLRLINSGQFGNGTAIFTNDGRAARRFEREVQVGMVGVNVPVPVPVAYFAFGGWKDSLLGDAPAYGPEGFAFFTRQKAVTSRWVTSTRSSLNMGFPEND
ncbi:CoA-acylating methylmalonate-semialdehyde dehydrogenase [Micromonospora sp. B11E3]|uniref:CoA-acylating methylmalonate-semialdehyde dehydrogenase n=1 Tax=Micromonospora sp. B11E3 TaxID=3153562 RepID=UPI00325E81FD